MRPLLILLGLVLSQALPAQAQPASRIYRCGNSYTHTAPEAGRTDCKVLEGGNLTVVQTARPSPPARAGAGSMAGLGTGGTGAGPAGVPAATTVARVDTGV